MDKYIRLFAYLLFLISIPLASALKLDITAHPGHEAKSKERCIRNFVAKDQLVVVTAKIDGQRGDNQVLNMHIRDSAGNDYHRPKDVVGENRWAFTSHSDSSFDVCLENLWVMPHHGHAPPSRHLDIDIDIGADAKDWNAIQADEKLKPVESELKRIDEVVSEIVKDFEHLRQREMKLRNTNESTNERVKWFALCTMSVLVALCGWQIMYLRAYFRHVRFLADLKLSRYANL